MKSALDLYHLIEQVKGKLKAENVAIDDYDKCIEVLNQTCNPKVCVDIYEKYVNY